MISYSLWVN